MKSNRVFTFKEMGHFYRLAFNYYRYHEALKNVTPFDVYSGHQSEILQRTWEVKVKTSEERKRYNSTIRRQDVSPENVL